MTLRSLEYLNPAWQLHIAPAATMQGYRVLRAPDTLAAVGDFLTLSRTGN